MNILHRMRRWFGLRINPPGPHFFISRDYQLRSPFPQYDARRPFRILNCLESAGLLKRGTLQRPRPVSLKRLQAVHDPAYVQSLQDPLAMEAVVGFRLEPQLQDNFLAFQRLMCGGTLKAARNALQRRDIAVNLGGGLHHAARTTGSGFCIFNDVAVAIDHLRNQGHAFPILVIDLDLHDGDGTREIFADDPTVHTFSIHNKDLGKTEAVASTSIALGAEVEDDTYLATVQESLPPVIAAFRPGLVFYLAGSDPCIDDRLGNWRISSEGMMQRDRLVMDLVRPSPKRVSVPTVILLAGGYGPTAWRHGAAFFSWLLAGESRLDIPLELELPVDHYRRLARHMKRPGLSPREQDPEPVTSEDWGLTEADIGGAVAGAVGGAPNAGLFLGQYTHHGLEWLLEEVGLMTRLRDRGLSQLAVELDLADPMGQTLRVTTGHHHPVVVLELKLRVTRKEGGSPYDLLVVEWLLAQDTRAQEEENARPLLPGQKHRGMGLLRDTAAVLIVATERLELDGVMFTPSHFHLARLARGQGRFPVPEDEARYLAMEKSVKGLRLQEASAAVTQGRVRSHDTGEIVTWIPRKMIIPVNASLRKELHGDEFSSAVARASRQLDFRLD